MKLQKFSYLILSLVAAFITLNASIGFAQFTGSVTLGGYRSSNVEGRDSASPDNVFDPTIDLIYNWNVSTPTQLKFEATINPNLFQTVPSRSFLKSFFGATGNFYLSDVDENPKAIPAKLIKATPTAVVNNSEPPKQANSTDTTKQVITIKPAVLEMPQIASVKLAILSELLDSFEINTKGLSSDSSDDASDLKDSVSEGVLALSDILASQVFTESIAEVVLNELISQKKIFADVPMEANHKAEINKGFDELIILLKGGKPQSDVLPIPIPTSQIESSAPIVSTIPSSPKNDLIAQALAHLQAEDQKSESPKGENAPILTLINSQTEFKDISSQDILLKEDATPMTKKTLATLLSVPASLEIQNNNGAYKSYGYTEFEFKPRLDIYSEKNFGVGVTYDLTKIRFPLDTIHLNDGTENKLRLDTRIQATPGFVFSADGGLSTKNYDDPIKYFVPVKGKADKIVATSANYSHYFLGGGLMFFPADRFSLSVVGTVVRSASLRPYLIDSTLSGLTGRSRIGGTQNDDEYSYNLSRLSVFTLWRIFWDMKFSFDLSYENRSYATQQIARNIPNLRPVTVKRDDYGPQFGLDLSKEFLFDSKLISIFDSFTPTLDIQSSNYTSTVKLFSYKDVTTTLSFEFGF